MKKYLPSKKFLYLFGSFLVIAIVFFIAFKLLSNKNSFSNSNNSNALQVDRLAQAGLTVNQLIQKDSDNDGVPDWEEALWGTDPHNRMTFAGLTDAAYIAGKKKELNIDQTKDEAGETETDKFAKEFFTAYVAMKASGTVDPDAINNFSNSLGQSVVNPTLIDLYTTKDVKTSTDNSATEKTKYYNAVKKLFENAKSEGVGDELTIINNQIAGPHDDTNQDQLNKISKAYENFASSVIKLTVPSDLAGEHLKIANDATNTGISIQGMTKVTSDPIVGLSGVSQYQKYSDDLISTVGSLEAKLQ